MSPPPSLLIFQWGAQYRKPLKWVFSLLAAAAIHAVLLYFIRVSPRAVAHSIPMQGRVVLLSAAIEEQAALLTRLEDKSSLQPQARPAFPGDLTFAALPGFQRLNYEPKFRPLPSEATPAKRSGILTVTGDLARWLPVTQLPPVVPAPPVASKAPSPVWRATGELAERLPSGLVLQFPPLADQFAYAFQLGVNAGGQVIFALPVQGGDSQVRAALLRQLRAVRFLPRAEVPMAWGMLERVP